MLNVLCAPVLSQRGTEVSHTDLVDSEVVDTEVYSRVAEWKKPTRSPLTPTQTSSLSPNVPIGSSSSPRPGSTSAIASIEDRTVPQFSSSPCQQAACLIESNPAVTLDTQTELTELEPPIEQSGKRQAQSEETQSKEILLGTEALEEADGTETSLARYDADYFVPTARESEAAVPVSSSATLDFSSGVIAQSTVTQTDQGDGQVLDDDLGTLRLQQTRSRENEELGILRLLQTAQAPPPPPKQPIAFIGGRLGFVDTNNAFRTETAIEDQIYQTGLTLYLFPQLSEKTNLYAIAETSLARYNADYNEIEVQAGIRHRLFRRTFAQVGWRNQRLYTPGFREKIVGTNHLDALISHRRILSKRAWLDGFYQLRLGFADPAAASRFRQTLITSFNYAPTPKLRTSLVYQLEFVDYLQIDRFDISQQFLGVVSYNLTPESRLSLFGGTRFGSSSAAGVGLDDIFYGAGLNVNVPLF